MTAETEEQRDDEKSVEERIEELTGKMDKRSRRKTSDTKSVARVAWVEGWRMARNADELDNQSRKTAEEKFDQWWAVNYE